MSVEGNTRNVDIPVWCCDFVLTLLPLLVRRIQSIFNGYHRICSWMSCAKAFFHTHTCMEVEGWSEKLSHGSWALQKWTVSLVVSLWSAFFDISAGVLPHLRDQSNHSHSYRKHLSHKLVASSQKSLLCKRIIADVVNTDLSGRLWQLWSRRIVHHAAWQWRDGQLVRVEKTGGKSEIFMRNALLQLAQWEHSAYINPVHEIYIFICTVCFHWKRVQSRQIASKCVVFMIYMWCSKLPLTKLFGLVPICYSNWVVMKGLCSSLERKKNMVTPWFCGTAGVLFKPMCKGREMMCQVYPIWKECNCSGSEAKLRISYSLMYSGTRVYKVEREKNHHMP